MARAVETSPDSTGGTAASGVRSFDGFTRSQYREVLALVRSLVKDLATAEDLTQEAFSRALARWDSVRAHPNPEAWVRRVAINLACSRWRRLKAEAAALARLAPREPELSSMVHVDVWAAVHHLPPRERQVTVLFYVDGMKVAQIAETLELREGTVKATLNHARRKLAQELGVEE